MVMYLVFDCETTGLVEANKPLPRLVQLAWQLHNKDGALRKYEEHIVAPEGFEIPFAAAQVHHISTERAKKEGKPLKQVLESFEKTLTEDVTCVGHNLGYDIRVLNGEFERLGRPALLAGKSVRDTMKESCEYLNLPGGRGGKPKFPRLDELYAHLFKKKFPSAHNAAFDVAATAACFFELLKKGVISPQEPTPLQEIHYESPEFFTEIAEEKPSASTQKGPEDARKPTQTLSSKFTHLPFAHLHIHSQYSFIPGTLSVEDIVSLAKKHHMKAVALTDIGNMCGAFAFAKQAKHLGIKPIIGCDFFLSEQRLQKKFSREIPDKRSRQVLLAKNEEGYKNLCHLSSLGYVEGLYGLYPRIDKALVETHRSGLVALSGPLESELPHLIIHRGKDVAEEALKWWREVFEKDFYLECFTHDTEETKHVNQILLEWAKKYHLPILPAQEIFYETPKDKDAHDTLLCIKDNATKSAKISAGNTKRRAFKGDHYFFSSPTEIHTYFAEEGHLFTHLAELLEKIETYSLEKKVLLPQFPLPQNFTSDIQYLSHLAKKGAKEKYEDRASSSELQERLKYELRVMGESGFAGYFLITHEIVTQARKMGVYVGPGRGSVAGSLVAYALGITEIDPLRYGLMFERFLNPERISMPDIDIDFDDENREKLIKWIIERYGATHVAQIITHGTMAARSAIRDCARVLELPLAEADKIAKQVPGQIGYTLAKAYKQPQLKQIYESEELAGKVLRQAEIIEGMVRHSGTHACGFIITPSPLQELVPLMKTHDTTLPVTQYDNSVVEQAGLLKMDFLGLRTLSILRTTLQAITKHRKENIDLHALPMDDVKTYALFQRGQTAGIFQFESPGMQRYLRALKPDRFEDLIAMNALYRPGPMDYIDSFIARKHKREPITYDIEDMQDILAETYGITVYQEQVMRLSEMLAGFSKSQADTLRYAMGKKKRDVLDKLKPLFLQGFQQKYKPLNLGEKIWKDWEAFASYAFNKSHATCYAQLAYQTAYLKANYPQEYLAAVLTHNQDNSEKVAFFVEECRAMGIRVLPPSVNESEVSFSVKEKKSIRFGMTAIKGIGAQVAEQICAERTNEGSYQNIFDLTKRLTGLSKKTYECLAQAGAFDTFHTPHRRAYLEASEGDKTLIDKALAYAQPLKDHRQSSFFSKDEQSENATYVLKNYEKLTPYTKKEALLREKEVLGTYLSGHPLDALKPFSVLCTTDLYQLSDTEHLKQGVKYKFFALLSEYKERQTQKGRTYAICTIEDFTQITTVSIFGEVFNRHKSLLKEGAHLYITATLRPRFSRNHDSSSQSEQPMSLEIISLRAMPKELGTLIQSIILRIDVTKASQSTFDHIENTLSQAQAGPTSIRMHLYENKQIAKFYAKKYQIVPSTETVQTLQNIEAVELTLEPRR